MNWECEDILEREILWEPDKYQNSIGLLLRYTYRSFYRSLSQMLEPHDISMGQWFLLRALWEEDGISQSKLARRAGVLKSAAVALVRELEEKKWIKRSNDPSDKRKLIVFLTPDGMVARDKFFSFGNVVNEKALKGISNEDFEVLKRVLTTARKNLADT